MKGILGKKIGMTQVFSETGEVIPVTVVQVEKNKVLQVKTNEIDGYNAIQLGVEDKKERNTNKPETGHANKAKSQGKRFKKEIRLTSDEVQNYELGQELDVSIFEPGEIVDVQGTSKGKGFQGVIKRHGQSRGPMSHGSRYHRRPGSMGAVAPAVFKGKNLPGHMGQKTVTLQNLEIVLIDYEQDVLLIKGNVPGGKNSYLAIKSSIKNPEMKVDIVDLVGLKLEPVVEEEAVEEAVPEVKEAVVEEAAPEVKEAVEEEAASEVEEAAPVVEEPKEESKEEKNEESKVEDVVEEPAADEE